MIIFFDGGPRDGESSRLVSGDPPAVLVVDDCRRADGSYWWETGEGGSKTGEAAPPGGVGGGLEGNAALTSRLLNNLIALRLPARMRVRPTERVNVGPPTR